MALSTAAGALLPDREVHSLEVWEVIIPGTGPLHRLNMAAGLPRGGRPGPAYGSAGGRRRAHRVAGPAASGRPQGEGQPEGETGSIYIKAVLAKGQDCAYPVICSVNCQDI